jgi:hypothetical protein
MEFEIDDMDYQPGDALPAAIKRVLEVVKAMPDGKLYSSARVAHEAGLSKKGFYQFSTHPLFEPFKVDVKGYGNRCYYGNAKTIKAFKHECERRDDS